MSSASIKICLAQIAPVWLNKTKTVEKILDCMKSASAEKSNLIVFGEALLPGYPFWLSATHGSKFNSKIQKEIFAYYLEACVYIEAGDLDKICQHAKASKMAVYLGTVERAKNRGGHSLYCSLVYINELGEIKSVHRKLQPTYEERLAWSPGDGHGLTTHKLSGFCLGGLNCWENWMPLSRTALYAMGENLHIAVWPGAVRNTIGITRFIAEESRSYVVSVSGLMNPDKLTEEIPHVDVMRENPNAFISDGGSCIAGPDGKWIVEPLKDDESLIYQDLDLGFVHQERQNFDPAGHYSRPDVTRLVLNNKRQSILDLTQ